MPQLQLFTKLDDDLLKEIKEKIHPELLSAVEGLREIFDGAVQNMLDFEEAEFAEGFIAGLLFSRVQMIEAEELMEAQGRSYADKEMAVRVHLDTALWVLATKLKQLRSARQDSN